MFCSKLKGIQFCPPLRPWLLASIPPTLGIGSAAWAMLAQKETLQELIMKPGALGYQTSMVSTPGNREKQHQHVHAPSTWGKIDQDNISRWRTIDLKICSLKSALAAPCIGCTLPLVWNPPLLGKGNGFDVLQHVLFDIWISWAQHQKNTHLQKETPYSHNSIQTVKGTSAGGSPIWTFALV